MGMPTLACTCKIEHFGYGNTEITYDQNCPIHGE